VDKISIKTESFDSCYIRMCDDWRTMFDLLRAMNWMRDNLDKQPRINLEII